MKRVTEPPVAPTKTKKLRIFCGTQSSESCARKITTEVSDTFLPSLQTASEELDGLSDPATQRIHDNFLIASKPFLDVREQQETVINKFCKIKILMVEHQTRELEKLCDKQYEEKLMARITEEQKKHAEELKDQKEQEEQENAKKAGRRGGRKRLIANNMSSVMASLSPAGPPAHEPLAVEELGKVVRLSDKDIREDLGALQKILKKNVHIRI